MSQKRTKKPWTRMTQAELRDATKQYDREIPLEQTQPLSPQEQREWDNLDRSPPRRNGGRVIAVRIDPNLLEQSDQYAESHGMTRDELIDRGLKHILASADR